MTSFDRIRYLWLVPSWFVRVITLEKPATSGRYDRGQTHARTDLFRFPSTGYVHREGMVSIFHTTTTTTTATIHYEVLLQFKGKQKVSEQVREHFKRLGSTQVQTLYRDCDSHHAPRTCRSGRRASFHALEPRRSQWRASWYLLRFVRVITQDGQKRTSWDVRSRARLERTPWGVRSRARMEACGFL